MAVAHLLRAVQVAAVRPKGLLQEVGEGRKLLETHGPCAAAPAPGLPDLVQPPAQLQHQRPAPKTASQVDLR